MFGARYSRMKFWLTSLPVIFIGSFFLGVANNVSDPGMAGVIPLIFMLILIHILANRIRGFGSNPWLALLAVLPFVGLFQAFYYGCKQSKGVTQEEP